MQDTASCCRGERLNNVEIRNLTIEDYASIVSLWNRSGLPFKPKGRDSEKMMKAQMKVFPELFVGAFHRNTLVGVAIGSYDGRMKGWINRVAVDPEHRRLGIAQQLVKQVEKTLEKFGAAIFCALVETTNKESLALFQKAGYLAQQSIVYLAKRRSKDT